METSPDKPVEFEVICYNCCNKFLAENKRTKYCSKKCQRHTAIKRWRLKLKPVFAPRNCTYCGDEYIPTREWQKCCSRGCLVLLQNNHGRKHHVGKPPRTPNLETFPGCKERKTYTLCPTKKCKSICHMIKRVFPDGTEKIISHQQGWEFINDALYCEICIKRINAISMDVAQNKDRVMMVGGATNGTI